MMCHEMGTVEEDYHRDAYRVSRHVFKYAPHMGRVGIEPTTMGLQDETASRQGTASGCSQVQSTSAGTVLLYASVIVW